MKNPKLRILTYLLAAAGLLLAAVIYPRLPQEIPTHWDLDGTVTYSGRHMKIGRASCRERVYEAV